VKLNTHLKLVWRLSKHGSIHPLIHSLRGVVLYSLRIGQIYRSFCLTYSVVLKDVNRFTGGKMNQFPVSECNNIIRGCVTLLEIQCKLREREIFFPSTFILRFHSMNSL
jgi:hypothetical protein